MAIRPWRRTHLKGPQRSRAATEVLKSITSVLIPLSVFMLPNRETLIPAIDKVVDRNFGIVLKVVEWQHELGAAALSHLGSVASN
jgi:hypothetical protein